ncbi:MAG: hypothetical protein QM796_14275 [Chthoniobacteraceae bacterium]
MRTAPFLSFLSALTVIAGALAHGADDQKFKLAHHSTFTPPASLHNPFWPIGWVPTPGEAPVAVPEVQAAFDPNSVVVSSVMLGATPQMAIINNKDYALGEMVSVGGAKAQLVGIRDGAIILRSGGRDYLIELKIQ